MWKWKIYGKKSQSKRKPGTRIRGGVDRARKKERKKERKNPGNCGWLEKRGYEREE